MPLCDAGPTELAAALASFGGSIGLVLLSPLLDDITWKRYYREFYRKYAKPPITATNLETSAQWAVNTAQTLPGVVLAIVGGLVLWERVGAGWAAAAVVAALAPLLVVAWQGRRQRLHETDTVRGTAYSLGQLLIVAANSVVIGAVLVAAHGACPS